MKTINVSRAYLLTALLLFLNLLAACSEPPDTVPVSEIQPEPPEGQLSDQVRPLHYWLRLTVDPNRDEFAGRTTILTELAEPTDRIWLHGHSLAVSSVTATPQEGKQIAGRYEQVTDTGVARVVFE